MGYKKISLLLMERTPYHDILINSLHSDLRIKLKVYFVNRATERRPWEFREKTAPYAYCNTYGRFIAHFLKDILKDKPDLVIATGYANPKIMISYFAMKLLKIKFAMWTDVPRLYIRRSSLKNSIRLAICRFLFKNSRAILTMGKPGIEAFQALGCPKDRIRNLPCAVDLDAPKQVSREDQEKSLLLKEQFGAAGKVIFLGAGRLSAEKGYDLALRAFAKCQAAAQGHQAVLWFAGDGPKKPELVNLVKQLELTGKVYFLGWQQPQDMQTLYSVANIFLHPARWEPFGVAVLEAMAWGLPVLASDQTMAALDRITQGKSGLIHRMGNVDELAGHMRYLLNNPEKIPIMGAKARQTAEEWPVSRSVQTIIDCLT